LENKLNQSWQGGFLGGSLSKLCPTARHPFKMVIVTQYRYFLGELKAMIPLLFPDNSTMHVAVQFGSK
jgi:hypothetical protein